jgi:hypothetical protein
MSLLGVRPTLLGAALIVAASCTSCSDGKPSPAAARNAKPTPEESFNTIVETFRRRIEDTPVGFVASNSTGRSSMIGTNKVSSELIRPTNQADPYKAVITVTSESRYRIRRTKKEASDDKERDQNSDTSNPNPLGEIGADKSVDALDPALISKPAPLEAQAGRITEDVITPPTSQEKDVRKYELVYENGRWTLITELNTKTEQLIQNAFRNALETQS